MSVELDPSFAARLFTVWSDWTPLGVFRAESFRVAREIGRSEEFLRILGRATVRRKPLLALGAKVWVGPANADERAVFHRAETEFPAEAQMVWLQPVDQ